MNNQKNRSHFVNQVTQKFSDRSYYTRHIKSRTAAQLSSYVLSTLSIFAGFTALYKMLINLTGVNDTLLNSLNDNFTLSLLIFAIAIPMLYFLEVLKHRFHSDGLQELFLVTDDLGAFERKVGAFLSIVSICLSGYGGYLIADEIAGTQDQKTIVAIESKYENKVNDLTTAIQSKKDEISSVTAKINDYQTSSKYQNRQGKILYKFINEISKLESQKARLSSELSSLEAQQIGVNDDIKSEQITAGVYDKIGLTMNSKATQGFIFKMAGGQLLIDILLYLCLRFVVFFEYKVAIEEGNIESKKEAFKESKKPKQVKTEVMDLDNGSAVYARQTIGFKTENRPQNRSKQTAPKQPQNFVTQDTQPQTKQPKQGKQLTIVGDYSKIRNNMMNNYIRLQKGYTVKRFENVKEGIEYFCSLGLKCWIDDSGKLQGDTLTSGSLKKDNVSVSWDEANKKLNIKYY